MKVEVVFDSCNGTSQGISLTLSLSHFGGGGGGVFKNVICFVFFGLVYLSNLIQK
ncbi:hypothetical protein HanIR_Chr03g0105221 [Helianthus annuus]|nr:hypothetical protein HanIR_Chr03g0105221 [Helianthus annuus]